MAFQGSFTWMHLYNTRSFWIDAAKLAKQASVSDVYIKTLADGGIKPIKDMYIRTSSEGLAVLYKQLIKKTSI